MISVHSHLTKEVESLCSQEPEKKKRKKIEKCEKERKRADVHYAFKPHSKLSIHPLCKTKQNKTKLESTKEPFISSLPSLLNSNNLGGGRKGDED